MIYRAIDYNTERCYKVNVLVDSRRRARLADFGLAKIVDESTSRTATAVGKRQGTVRWMAPELLYPDMFGFTGRFEKQLPSKDTDIYAIGMTILEVSAHLAVENTGFTLEQVITGCVPFASITRNETVMLKVIKGGRPDRPPSGLSETLWGLLVATWVEQHAQKPRERPSASAVLTRLKRCVNQWGKSIVPLIPKDWGDIGWCYVPANECCSPLISLLQRRATMMVPQLRQVIFIVGLVIPLLTSGLNDLARSRTEFAILLSQLNRPALAGLSGRVCGAVSLCFNG